VSVLLPNIENAQAAAQARIKAYIRNQLSVHQFSEMNDNSAII
jgi:hypothetical protein